MNVLPANLKMGAVSLRVADLDLMLGFYTKGVGLEVLAANPGSYILGSGEEMVLVLEHAPELKHASPSDAGLFHTAILFEQRSSLATAVMSVAQKYPGRFTGSADHLVSEAFYFDDPEGNGVELYFDRPRDLWKKNGSEIEMATLPLDPNAYLQEHFNSEQPGACAIGHVHLSVGSLDQARDFYLKVIGFDLTNDYGNSALFVSAGGYHHHMAMNIWRSRGAGRRQQTLGLGDLALELGTQDALAALEDRAIFHGLQVQNDGISLRLDDPWGNQVTIRA